MKRIVLIIWVLVLAVGTGQDVQAKSSEHTATAFAPIEYGARPIAMGGAYVALSNDATGVMWNPAGLGYMALDDRQISAMYANLFGIDNLHNSFICFAQPDKGFGAAGLALTNTSATFEASDENSEDKAYTETMISYTFARRVGRVTSIGLTLKGLIIRSDFDYGVGANERTGNAGGGGFDVGVIFRPFADVAFGFSMRDAYTKLNWDRGGSEKLPIQFRTGIAAMPVSTPGLIVALDLAGDEDTYAYDLALGGEYTVREVLALRAGISRILPEEESRTVPSFGVGILFYSIQFNFAYSDDGELGSTTRFDLKIKF